MTFTVARDKEGNLGLFIGIKPERIELNFSNGEKLCYWTSNEDNEDYEVIKLPSELFPDLKWEDEPLEFQLTDFNSIDLIKEEINRQIELDSNGDGSNVYDVCTELISFIDLLPGSHKKQTSNNVSSNVGVGENLINELRKYLENTSEEQKEKDWKEIESLFPSGIKKDPTPWEDIDSDLKIMWDTQSFPNMCGERMMYINERDLKWIVQKSAEYQRRQMMKDAQDALVVCGSDGELYSVPIKVNLDENKFTNKEKVKLIVIKTNE